MNQFRNHIKKKNTVLFLVILHVILGVLIFVFPVLSKTLSLVSIVIGILYVLKTRNKDNEVLLFCAYYVGSDVFLRMTGGLVFYELTKYLIIVFLMLGFVYKHLSKKGLIYFVYLLFLIPAIFITSYSYEYDSNLKKSIAFNLSGPVALGIMALYCYNRRVKFDFLNKLLLYLTLPIVSMSVYLFLYTPNLQDFITGTQSNFAASGGFGPNQVSSILGLGSLALAIRFFIFSPSFSLKLLNSILFVIISFRALLTFSRGGVLTAMITIFMFVAAVFLISKGISRRRITTSIIFAVIGALGIWIYTISFSGGLIENRYTNRDASGRQKDDFTTGRSDLVQSELLAFKENPILGIGVGNNKQFRQNETGIESATHNEITRILAEHGLFGIMAFLILFLMPLYRFFLFDRNIFFFSFFLFWFLTINHSAMRIAAPAFIYGLSLLTITSEKNTVHRQQIRQ